MEITDRKEKMKPINKNIRSSGTISAPHDTRGDVRKLANYCNMLADKINELNDEVQELRKQLESQK